MMELHDRFLEEDLPFFIPDGKVGILATIDNEGHPHMTLITAMQALDPGQIVFGQFCDGFGKENARIRGKTGFLFMTLDKQLWRGKAIWREARKTGPEFEMFNKKPMWRYNSYFGIHTVHYLDVIGTTRKEKLPMGKIVSGVIATNLIPSKPNERYQYPQGKPWTQEALPPFPPQGAGYLTLLSRHSLGKWNQHTDSAPLASLGNQTHGGKLEVMNDWSRMMVSKVGALKFLAYIDEDGYPMIVPSFSCKAVANDMIVFPRAEYADEIALVPEGSVALYAMALSMETVMVKGKFAPSPRMAFAKAGSLLVEQVYNPMPPVPGVIYPPRPLEPVKDFS